MLIMCIHPMVYKFSVEFCITQYRNSIIIAILNSIITFLVSVPVYYLVNRYCPVLIGKGTKNDIIN